MVCWPAYSQPKRDFTDDEIIARMMIPMINEVVRCLEEGASSPARQKPIWRWYYGLGFLRSTAARSAGWTRSAAPGYLDMASSSISTFGLLGEVREGLRNKARHNEPYYPAVGASPSGWRPENGLSESLMERLSLLMRFAPRWAVQKAARSVTCARKTSPRTRDAVASLARNPALDPAALDDIYWGCCSRPSEQGFNTSPVTRRC